MTPLQSDNRWGRELVYEIESDSNFPLASSRVGGATDHIVTNGSASGMYNSCFIDCGSEAGKVIRTVASGTRHPVK